MSVYTAVFKKIQKLTLEGAVDDMRHIRDSSTICLDGQLIQGSLRARLPLWQRGWFVNSAAYINELNAEGDWGIPRNAVKLARQILAAEAQYLEELQAASVAGLPWQGTFGEKMESCIRCGERSSWRFVLKRPPAMPPEMVWRLGRPENAVPICRRCVVRTQFDKREDIRYDLAWGLWAARFEGLHRWYLAGQNDWIIDGWVKEQYPLWPRQFGGSRWKTGSGSFIDCLPRPPRGISRASVHFAALNRALGISTKRHEKIGPYFSALQLSRVNPDSKLEAGEYYCERGCIYRGTSSCSHCSRNWDISPGDAG
jgi:hypothetical protein